MPAILHVFSVALAAAALASSPTGAKASPEGSGLPWEEGTLPFLRPGNHPFPRGPGF